MKPDGPPGTGPDQPEVLERPTMRSVAALAGVGKTTVSRAFNSGPTVAADIVARVRKAAALLNYHPNRTASDPRRRDRRPSTIGLLIPDVSNAPATQRDDGYVEALRDVGVELDPSIVKRDADTEEVAMAECVDLLSRPEAPTGFFTAHNRSTLGALRAFSLLGCEGTRALIGFDDFPLFDRLKPGVSVVAQDPRALGQTGAQLLFRRIAGDSSPAGEHIVKTRLITRGSGEVPVGAAGPGPQAADGRGKARAGRA